MPGGIIIPIGTTAAELFGIAAVRAYESSRTVNQDETLSDFAGWRPPQWGKGTPSNYLYMITIPGPYTSQLGKSFSTGTSSVTQANNGTYTMSVGVAARNETPTDSEPLYLMFDGVMRATHSQNAHMTNYPVQNNSNFTDHIILEPATLSLDIVMSDAVQSYASGQWIGNPSKSISCFQMLDRIRAARIPLVVSTRLKSYANMALVNVIPEETVKTRYGLRARLDFRQMNIAQVASGTVPGASARQQTTDETQYGPTNTIPVPSGVTSHNMLPSEQNDIPSSTALQGELGQVVGAGNWSSNNTGALPQDW